MGRRLLLSILLALAAGSAFGASGDVVGQCFVVMPTGSSYATPDIRAGGTTVAENLRVWEFDAAAEEHLDFVCHLSGYGSGGITIRYAWGADTATSRTVDWCWAFRYIADDADDVDVSHTYDYNCGAVTAPSAAGEWSYDTETFTDGADMDSTIDGGYFILRLQRDGDDGTNDTMTGDAQFVMFVIEET